MKGLFLGAGASYEVGMPLVWEFSQTLRENVLKRIDSKLFNFESNQELKSFFIETLSNKNLHYEQVVGLLEDKYIQNVNSSQLIHGVIFNSLSAYSYCCLKSKQTP